MKSLYMTLSLNIGTYGNLAQAHFKESTNETIMHLIGPATRRSGDRNISMAALSHARPFTTATSEQMPSVFGAMSVHEREEESGRVNDDRFSCLRHGQFNNS